MREVPQVRAPSTGSFKNLFSVTRPRDLQDERTVEMQIVEERQQCRPIDCALSRGKVIVIVTVVVAGMHHPEMTGQLVNHGKQIFSEVRVPRIKANANFKRIQSA